MRGMLHPQLQQHLEHFHNACSEEKRRDSQGDAVVSGHVEDHHVVSEDVGGPSSSSFHATPATAFLFRSTPTLCAFLLGLILSNIVERISYNAVNLVICLVALILGVATLHIRRGQGTLNRVFVRHCDKDDTLLQIKASNQSHPRVVHAPHDAGNSNCRDSHVLDGTRCSVARLLGSVGAPPLQPFSSNHVPSPFELDLIRNLVQEHVTLAHLVDIWIEFLNIGTSLRLDLCPAKGCGTKAPGSNARFAPSIERVEQSTVFRCLRNGRSLERPPLYSLRRNLSLVLLQQLDSLSQLLPGDHELVHDTQTLPSPVITISWLRTVRNRAVEVLTRLVDLSWESLVAPKEPTPNADVVGRFNVCTSQEATRLAIELQAYLQADFSCCSSKTPMSDSCHNAEDDSERTEMDGEGSARPVEIESKIQALNHSASLVLAAVLSFQDNLSISEVEDQETQFWRAKVVDLASHLWSSVHDMDASYCDTRTGCVSAELQEAPDGNDTDLITLGTSLAPTASEEEYVVVEPDMAGTAPQCRRCTEQGGTTLVFSGKGSINRPSASSRRPLPSRSNQSSSSFRELDASVQRSLIQELDGRIQMMAINEVVAPGTRSTDETEDEGRENLQLEHTSREQLTAKQVPPSFAQDLQAALRSSSYQRGGIGDANDLEILIGD